MPRFVVGSDVCIRATGCVGKVVLENGHACKVCGRWFLVDELEVMSPGTADNRYTSLSFADARPGKTVVCRSWLLEQSRGHPKDHYELLQELGRGAFGVVHLVRPLNGAANLVCKVVDKRHACGDGMTDDAIKSFQDEIQLLRDLDHPNVNRLVEHYEDYKNLYMILGYASGGDLVELICWADFDVSESFLANVFRQVLEATAYCHGKHIIHKDLKPDNIMFLTKDYEHPHVVVIDFGAAELYNKRTNRFAGTPGYIAPEVWQAVVSSGQFGPKCDIYSIGAMLFYCLSEAELPWFQADTSGDLQKHAKRSLFLFKTRSVRKEFDGVFQGSGEARDLAVKMLAHGESERLNAEQCLQHSWLHCQSAPGLISKRVLNVLAKNATKNNVKKRFLYEAAMQIPRYKIWHITSIFKLLDTDANGTLSIAEVAAGFHSLGMDFNVAEATAKSLDLDDNGVVEYTEFLAGLPEHCAMQFEEAVWTVFCKYDVDRSGYIDIAELREMLQQGQADDLGQVTSMEEARYFLSVVDRDGDQQISFDELCSYLLSNAIGPGTGTLRKAVSGHPLGVSH